MYVLILLGLFIGIFSVLLLSRPEIGFDFGRKHFFSPLFQYGVGFFSIFLAAAIYYVAAESKFPELFQIIALFSMVGGIVVTILPQKDFQSIVSWELETFLPYARLLGLMYAFVGSFVVYAAI